MKRREPEENGMDWAHFYLRFFTIICELNGLQNFHSPFERIEASFKIHNSMIKWLTRSYCSYYKFSLLPWFFLWEIMKWKFWESLYSSIIFNLMSLTSRFWKIGGNLCWLVFLENFKLYLFQLKSYALKSIVVIN